MIEFDVSTTIARPVADVFAFVADGERMPLWNSAVKDVRKTTPGAVGAGTAYWMGRRLPQGWAENTLAVTEHVPGRVLTLKTTSGPTPFVYRYRFAAAGGGTRLSLHAEVETGGFASVVAPVLALGIKRGVVANFATLKRLLEAAPSYS